MGIFKKIFNNLRVIGKSMTVHTEMIVDNKVWEKVREHVKNDVSIYMWYVITPHNFDIFQPFFRLKMTKEEFEELLIQRYKWMMKNRCNLQLHIHLSKNMDNITKNEQRKLILDSIQWFEDNLDWKVYEIVPGWWSYNQDTIDIIEGELGLSLAKRYEFKECHDYDWVK